MPSRSSSARKTISFTTSRSRSCASSGHRPRAAAATFEYFNEAVHHDKKKTRSDYTANPNDNILIQGVERNKYALGYIPYAYYVPRAKSLRAVKIKLKEGDAGVEPTPQTITGGGYHPFARPLFIYVNLKSLERPEVAAFAQFYTEFAGS